MRQILLVLIFILSGLPAYAATQVSARKRSSTDCTYFSQIYVDTKLTYLNPSLPWGTKVELVSGLKKVSHWSHAGTRVIDWQFTETTTAPAISDYTWEVIRTTTFAVRGVEYIGAALQFVWKITLPDGTIQYDKGSSSLYGYYEVDFESLNMACDSLDKISFQSLNINKVIK